MGDIQPVTTNINTKRAIVTKEFYNKTLSFARQHTTEDHAKKVTEVAFTDMWEQDFTKDPNEPLIAYESYLCLFVFYELYPGLTGKKF